MPDFVRTAITTAAQSLDGAQSGLVTRNGGIYADGTPAVDVTAGTNWLTNDGYIYAYGGSFAALRVEGSSFELLNGKDGIVTAENPSAGTIDSALTGALEITNHGLIHLGGSDTIDLVNGDPTVIFKLQNFGTISAGTSRALDVEVGNGWSYIINAGALVADSDTVSISASPNNSSVHTFNNSGTVTARTGLAMAYDVGETGDVWLTNSGEISGAAGAFALTGTTTTDVRIINTGLIQTIFLEDNSIRLSNGDDGVINTGTLIGNVELGGGDDEFDGRGGTLIGQVEGGAGNDVYHIADAAIVIIEFNDSGTDTVFIANDYALGGNIENLNLLGADAIKGVGNGEDNSIQGNAGSNRLGASQGNDTVFGRNGDDSIYGGGGNDSLDGGEGDDYISGGSGGDTILGGEGDDVLQGRRGFDSINVGDGADFINGGTGGDILLGGQENDTLVGGDGSDSMNGGSGSDTFVWNSAGESPNSGQRDIINGFEIGLDLLDVSGLAAVPMEVSIGGGLAGSGTPSLRTFETNGGDTRIYIDVDGDNGTDMRIDLIGVTGVTGIDFIL